MKLVIVSAKKVDFTKVLKSLLTKNAILVINKSDLIKEKLNSKFKYFTHPPGAQQWPGLECAWPPLVKNLLWNHREFF